jgi:peptidylprolyl isomerase
MWRIPVIALMLALVACGGKKVDNSVPGGFVALDYLSDTPQQSFSAPDQVLKSGVDYFAEIDTTKGKMVIDLFQDEAPKTVNSFVFLALHRYYEGIVFHRVIENFMAQTGDPTGTGSGGPGYQFGLEVTPKLNYDKAGVLGMARTQNPNSNGSQFFITFQETPFLNQQYSIFGQVTEGLDVLKQISFTEGAKMVSPDKRDKILAVRILTRAQ